VLVVVLVGGGVGVGVLVVVWVGVVVGVTVLVGVKLGVGLLVGVIVWVGVGEGIGKQDPLTQGSPIYTNKPLIFVGLLPQKYWVNPGLTDIFVCNIPLQSI
jgi:hypothetical protein